MAKKLSLDVGPARHEVDVTDRPGGGYTMVVNDIEHVVSLEQVGTSNLHKLIIDGITQDVVIWRESTGVSVAIGSATHIVTISRGGIGNAQASASVEEGELKINSPMSGQVSEILVEIGATVMADAPLAVVVAMKMNNDIKSPVNGTVREIYIGLEDSVENGSPLFLLDVDET